DEQRFLTAAREGRIGSLLNVAFDGVKVDADGVYQEDSSQFFAKDPERTNKLQREAVENSRLGIPLLFAHDVIHGYRTTFPVPLAEACSWDPEQVERSARVAAIEASAAGIRWTFCPMIDIARDPRWGRIVEGSGEDPHLQSVMATARVRGFQGEDLADPESVLAAAKHYLGYGAAEGGRDYNTVDVSERTLREIYLPPFQAALDAGCGSVMVAFNEINGVPASGDAWAVRKLLRGEMGFDGLIVSDWGSIWEMTRHRSSVDLVDATEQAIEATVDVDMESYGYARHLAELVEQGRVPEQLVDDAVGRLLTVKFQLGLFDEPYIDSSLASRIMVCDEHRTAAREMAQKSIVLLKNEGDALPLAKTPGKVAVIGPLADNAEAQLGSWLAAGRKEDAITPLAELQKRLGDSVRYERGVEVEEPASEDSRANETDTGIAAAVALAKDSDVAILFVGEHDKMSGEAKSRSSLDLPGRQIELVKAVHATGTPCVVVLMNGRPLSIRWTDQHVPAIVEAWFLGVEAGPAIADVLLGDFNPGGKLPVTFPQTVGQVPLYYNHKSTGRPTISKYLDIPNKPLYPFGHGLSYTTFDYNSLEIAPAEPTIEDEITVVATVTNSGDRAGAEVVQLYLRDVAASVTPPVLELKNFRRIELAPGEQQRVAFTLTPKQLAVRNREGEVMVEPGQFDVLFGTSSVEGLKGSFRLQAE
ncbi:MAG: beta-glucosidase BglX, partial [Planctomycetota bacterium]